jgi:hypothetical protein
MVVLHVDEATSIQRQMARQIHAETHNAEVRRSGMGTLMCALPLHPSAVNFHALDAVHRLSACVHCFMFLALAFHPY